MKWSKMMKHRIITVGPLSKDESLSVRLSMSHLVDCENFVIKLIQEDKGLLSTLMSSVPTWGKPQAIIQKQFMVLMSEFELQELQKDQE